MVFTIKELLILSTYDTQKKKTKFNNISKLPLQLVKTTVLAESYNISSFFIVTYELQ